MLLSIDNNHGIFNRAGDLRNGRVLQSHVSNKIRDQTHLHTLFLSGHMAHVGIWIAAISYTKLFRISVKLR